MFLEQAVRFGWGSGQHVREFHNSQMLDTLSLSKGRECQVLNSFSLAGATNQTSLRTHFEPELLTGKCQLSQWLVSQL